MPSEKPWWNRFIRLEAILSFTGMTGIGSWFAMGWKALDEQGWGIYPIAGLVISFISAITIALIVFTIEKILRIRNKTITKEKPVNEKLLERVVGKKFERETVVLDGKAIINSTFKDVTIQYDGSPAHLGGNIVDGGINLTTKMPEIASYLKFLHSLDLLKTPVFVEGKKIAPELPMASNKLQASVYLLPPDFKDLVVRWKSPIQGSSPKLAVDFQLPSGQMERVHIKAPDEVIIGQTVKTTICKENSQNSWEWSSADSALLHDDAMICRFVLIDDRGVEYRWRFAMASRHFKEAPHVVGENLFNMPFA